MAAKGSNGKDAPGGAVSIDALLTQAQEALEKGALDQAQDLCRQVLAQKPDEPRAYLALSAISVKKRNYNNAFVFASRFRELRPDNAEAYNLLGGILIEMGKPEAAAPALREAMRLKPDMRSALENYSVVLQAQGDYTRAAEMLEALLESAPTSSKLWQRYSVSRHFPKGAPEVNRLKRVMQQPGLSAFDRAQMQFALAKMHQDAGDAKQAFRAYEAGNRLQAELNRKMVAHVSEGKFTRSIGTIMKVFDPEWIKTWEGRVPAHRGLTLLLGPPRSGKSLLEGPLTAHPRIKSYAEMDVILETMNRVGGDFSRHYPMGMRKLTDSGACRLSEMLDGAWGDPLQEGIATHLLTNPGHLFHAGTVMLLNPATHLVLCERDAVETAMAIYMKWFEKTQIYAWDIDTIAEYIVVYRRLARHWDEVFPGRVMRVRYEEMVARPDDCVREVLALHGLAWDEACADAHGHEVDPERVGLAGSGQGRARVNPNFGRIADFYKDQQPRFRQALDEAEARVTQALG